MYLKNKLYVYFMIAVLLTISFGCTKTNNETNTAAKPFVFPKRGYDEIEYALNNLVQKEEYVSDIFQDFLYYKYDENENFFVNAIKDADLDISSRIFACCLVIKKTKYKYKDNFYRFILEDLLNEEFEKKSYPIYGSGYRFWANIGHRIVLMDTDKKYKEFQSSIYLQFIIKCTDLKTDKGIIEELLAKTKNEQIRGNLLFLLDEPKQDKK